MGKFTPPESEIRSIGEGFTPEGAELHMGDEEKDNVPETSSEAKARLSLSLQKDGGEFSIRPTHPWF